MSREESDWRRGKSHVARSLTLRIARYVPTPKGQGGLARMAALLDCGIVSTIPRSRALPCTQSPLVTRANRVGFDPLAGLGAVTAGAPDATAVDVNEG